LPGGASGHRKWPRQAPGYGLDQGAEMYIGVGAAVIILIIILLIILL
jgi:hypothetical protein